MSLGKLKDIWDSAKDGGNPEKRSFVRYAIVSTAVFVVLVCFIGRGNVIRWARAGMEIRRQEKLIREYQEQIDRMDAQIKGLKADRDSLEKYARETFLFAEPGDDVYLTE